MTLLSARLERKLEALALVVRVPNEGGDRRSSEVIGGHRRSSEVIVGHQRSSEVIGGHRRSSEVITDAHLRAAGAPPRSRAALSRAPPPWPASAASRARPRRHARAAPPPPSAPAQGRARNRSAGVEHLPRAGGSTRRARGASGRARAPSRPHAAELGRARVSSCSPVG